MSVSFDLSAYGPARARTRERGVGYDVLVVDVDALEPADLLDLVDQIRVQL